MAIPLGGYPICRPCGALLHEPNEICPKPFACLSGPNCPHTDCRPTD